MSHSLSSHFTVIAQYRCSFDLILLTLWWLAITIALVSCPWRNVMHSHLSIKNILNNWFSCSWDRAESLINIVSDRTATKPRHDKHKNVNICIVSVPACTWNNSTRFCVDFFLILKLFLITLFYTFYAHFSRSAYVNYLA